MTILLSGQNEPAGHAFSCFIPGTGQNEPGGQGSYILALIEGQYAPAGQSDGTLIPLD